MKTDEELLADLNLSHLKGRSRIIAAATARRAHVTKNPPPANVHLVKVSFWSRVKNWLTALKFWK